MKRLILLLSCLVLAVSVSAQPRRMEHNVQHMDINHPFFGGLAFLTAGVPQPRDKGFGR